MEIYMELERSVAMKDCFGMRYMGDGMLINAARGKLLLPGCLLYHIVGREKYC